MTFQNQFSIGLELTKVIPIGLGVAGKTWEAAMKFARQLQSSSSDIVTEEDLAMMFGRNRIERHMASSFRTVVARPQSSEPFAAGISLLYGPGPTVSRALTQEPGGAYFAMVVQCMLYMRYSETGQLLRL